MKYFAVEVLDLMTREYWDIVRAVDEDDARAQVTEIFARHGGKAGRVRPATDFEIAEYKTWQDIGQE